MKLHQWQFLRLVYPLIDDKHVTCDAPVAKICGRPFLSDTTTFTVSDFVAVNEQAALVSRMIESHDMKSYILIRFSNVTVLTVLLCKSLETTDHLISVSVNFLCGIKSCSIISFNSDETIHKYFVAVVFICCLALLYFANFFKLDQTSLASYIFCLVSGTLSTNGTITFAFSF